MFTYITIFDYNIKSTPVTPDESNWKRRVRVRVTTGAYPITQPDLNIMGLEWVEWIWVAILFQQMLRRRRRYWLKQNLNTKVKTYLKLTISYMMAASRSLWSKLAIPGHSWKPSWHSTVHSNTPRHRNTSSCLYRGTQEWVGEGDMG